MALVAIHGKRQRIGLTLFGLGVALGSLSLFYSFVALPAREGALTAVLSSMCMGACIALPAMVIYLTVPRLLDRYDPEPWYALLGCLAWGAIASCGFSVIINTAVGEVFGALYGQAIGEAVATVVSAPVVEEFWKCLGVFGVFWFLQREFDGMVDGVIYACFVAIGFAAVENVIYYARAGLSGGSVGFGATVFARGFLTPWCHPLFTAMFGIGVGIARESTRPSLKWLGPLVGYLAAVCLHALWNGSSLLISTTEQGALACIAFSLWFIFVTVFVGIVVALVRRRGRIIREYLRDEVAIGTITSSERDLVVNPWGIWRATKLYGPRGREFARAVARLALSKWHATRAMNQSKHTISLDMIVPLRQRIAQLKYEQARASERG